MRSLANSLSWALKTEVNNGICGESILKDTNGRGGSIEGSAAPEAVDNEADISMEGDGVVIHGLDSDALLCL